MKPRYLVAKENAAANAPTIAVKTEIQDAISSGFEERSSSSSLSLEERLASAGRSEERPSPPFSPLDSWLMLSEELVLSSAVATEVPAKATATAVAPATSALREKAS